MTVSWYRDLLRLPESYSECAQLRHIITKSNIHSSDATQIPDIGSLDDLRAYYSYSVFSYSVSDEPLSKDLISGI